MRYAAGSVAGTDEAEKTRGPQAREIERKLFWYQDAIHEQELQAQLLEAKQRQKEEARDKLHGVLTKLHAEREALDREAFTRGQEKLKKAAEKVHDEDGDEPPALT